MRQQRADGLRGLGRREVLEEVVEVRQGPQAVGLGGFDEGVEDGADRGTLSTAYVQEILSIMPRSESAKQLAPLLDRGRRRGHSRAGMLIRPPPPAIESTNPASRATRNSRLKTSTDTMESQAQWRSTGATGAKWWILRPRHPTGSPPQRCRTRSTRKP